MAGARHWEGLDEDGDVVGWVALSTDFVDLKAYSGKPLVTLVGLDPDGIITGAHVVHHSEPILLVGIPEKALTDFVDAYAGKRALQRIVVGRADKPDVESVDGISGATVTALVQNITVLDTARSLGTSLGVFTASAVTPGHFVEDPEPWTFQQMLERGALGHLVVTHADLGMDEAADPYVDLYFGIADPSHVGRSLLGEHSYKHYKGQLAENEHLFVVFNRGSGSFKGSAFVRGGIFDRVRIQQGLREITFRDTDYWNMPDIAAEDAPEMNEGALFVLRGGRFDPGSPYDLVFLGSRYDHRGAFTRDFREFTATHQLPATLYVVDRTTNGIPWRQAWRNRRIDAAIFAVYLLLVAGVFVARQYTFVNLKRLGRLHMASMIFAFLVVGVYMGAQPSVTQIFTAVGSAVHEWRWDLFLSEPLIFIAWLFIGIVSLTWGRGVFCHWVCPYGAMNELAFKVSQQLGFKRYELPSRIHLKLRYLRYVVLAVLVGVFLWDSILAERMAEVEPFKSTFLVPIWTRQWGFIAWWLLLLALSFTMYRPFCRYLCPMGGGIALLSSFRPFGPKRRAFCSPCEICTRGCEYKAFRQDGTIDPRECFSCMECEVTYNDEQTCPPLIGLAMLEDRTDLSPRDQRKISRLRIDVADA
ncbi:MAG: 4Fe-4S binding protein [Deltaproteobacteria bacterium]|nr:4Fe-4S binding protein [Deltaproteobacteria bacterium]MBW2359363.1 4Fe-4S binding protein [Deltaproteobacteria bacterium]